MPRFHSRSTNRGNISLCALLIIQCLLILAMGPFQVAKAYLRADSAIHLAKSKVQYRRGATHAVRHQLSPGSAPLVFGGVHSETEWVRLAVNSAAIDHVHVKPDLASDLPELVSIWVHSPTRQFEIRGQLE